jgi:hypothetical protein
MKRSWRPLGALLAALLPLAPGCKASDAEPRPEPATTAGAFVTAPATASASWQSDPEAWLAIDALPGCATSIAREPMRVWPGFEFATCGPGCREAAVMPGSGKFVAAILGTSARVQDGTLRISLSSRSVSGPMETVLGTYAFGDGKPSLLVRETGTCPAQVAGRGSLSTFRLFPPRGAGAYRVAWLDGTPAGLRWLSPAQTRLVDAYDFDGGWGGIDAFETLLGAGDPGVALLEPLYTSPGTIAYPSSSAGLVVFAEWLGSAGRVMAWRPAHGAAPIASGPWRVARVGASAERVAWLGALGERAGEGLYTSARLYSCTRPDPGAACRIDPGPALPITSSGGILAIQGHFVALNGCVEAGCSVYLADLANSRLYRVPPPHEGHGAEVIGLSDTELLVADYSKALRGTPDFDKLVRYELAKVGEFAIQL